MLATNTKPENQKRPPNIRVGGESVVDALADLRHEARLLTLAITGYIMSPDDVSGDSAAMLDPAGKRDPDADWGHDIEALAGRMTTHLERILAAVEAGEQS